MSVVGEECRILLLRQIQTKILSLKINLVDLQPLPILTFKKKSKLLRNQFCKGKLKKSWTQTYSVG